MMSYIVSEREKAEEIIKSLGLVPVYRRSTDTVRGYMRHPFLVDASSITSRDAEKAIVVTWNQGIGIFVVFCHIMPWGSSRCTTDLSRVYPAESYDDLVDMIDTVRDNIKFTVERYHDKSVNDILSVLPD